MRALLTVCCADLPPLAAATTQAGYPSTPRRSP
jgi:hypothetical protein